MCIIQLVTCIYFLYNSFLYDIIFLILLSQTIYSCYFFLLIFLLFVVIIKRDNVQKELCTWIIKKILSNKNLLSLFNFPMLKTLLFIIYQSNQHNNGINVNKRFYRVKERSNPRYLIYYYSDHVKLKKKSNFSCSLS